MNVEKAIQERRSFRAFIDTALTREQISQLFWSAQGITDSRRQLRAAPSAGATFPLEMYVVTAEGISRYLPREHALASHLGQDIRADLRRASLDQPWVESAPAVFVIAADLSRIVPRYGDRAERYTWIEVGHAAQNLLLQAAALGLGGVPVAAFDDAEVTRILRLPSGQRALYLIPLGRPRR